WKKGIVATLLGPKYRGVLGCAYSLVQDLYIIQINRFSAFMNDSHKMITGSKLRGSPHAVEGLLVEAIGWIIDDNRPRPETHPALIAQTEPCPCKAEGCFIPNTI